MSAATVFQPPPCSPAGEPKPGVELKRSDGADRVALAAEDAAGEAGLPV